MITFTKTEAKDFSDMKPGQWFKTSTGNAIIACPKCGKYAELNHTIALDGTVSPSLVCPFSPCDFHDYGNLEGWQ